MIPNPSKLSELQLASITEGIKSPSIKQFVKFIATNPDSTTAKVIGQTGINDIVEANRIAAEPLFKKGYFLAYQLTGSQSDLKEQWRIAKIPYHAEHCQTADELSEYVNQLCQVLNANQELRGEA
jgi:hypothetical protein